MPTLIIMVINICFILFFLVLLILPGRSTASMRAPFLHRNMAHRGLHTKDKKVPENSLAAFKAAVDAGYGIELDIQFSKDEKIVVFHDDTLKRVCGIEGRVDDYTYEELQKFSLCGTNEHIPLFTDFLAVVNGSVPFILEFKNGPKNDLLCEHAYEILKEYNGDYCIESFQPLIVGWFKRNAPHVLRGQLSAPVSDFKGQLNKFNAFFLSRLLTNVVCRPHFIAYHKEKRSWLVKLTDHLGAMRVVWTVRDSDDHKQLESINDTVIFEFYHPEVKY